ncbi:Hypothetical protein CINCED_3A005918 [Cinara cedri]|uniref:Uncharacterized protein n=1 Tax=Cinara cedri TaxID=506608 RepID=A0A5E4MPX4_9HEMI|nr:Hypothetical protein CINCED_3A005918 [Cinara cedri]
MSTDVAQLAVLLVIARYIKKRKRKRSFVLPSSDWTHNRQALASKPLPADLKDVLDDSCKVVNFIKSRHTNSRIFSLLCEDMGSLHKTLLLHTGVRWLSRGKVLTRLFELRHEVQMFFKDHPFRLSSKFNDHEWLQKLGYLSDVFFEIKQSKFDSSKQCSDNIPN